MSLLDKLGLAPKKARPVGQTLERGRSDESQRARVNAFSKTGIFLGLVLLTLLAFPQNERYDYLIDVGDTWRRETVIAPFDFAIYKDAETIRAERQQVRFRTAPYFRAAPGGMEAIQANRDTLASQLDRIFEAYASYRQDQAAERFLEADRDSIRYVELRRNARLKLTPDQWQLLVRSYSSLQSGLPQDGSMPGGSISAELLRSAWEVSLELARTGVFDISADSVATDQIIIRNEKDRTDERVDKANLYGLDQAYTIAQERFAERFNDRPELASLAYAFFRVIFQPTLDYLRADTIREWQSQEERISPTHGIVREGEVIVREQDRVTEDISRRLRSLGRVQRERSGANIFWRITLGQFLLTITTYVLFFLYLFLLRRPIFNDNRQILLIALLFIGIIALYAIAIRLPSVAMLAVPVAISSILLTVVFDSRVGLFGTITLALIGGHLLGYDFEFAFATIFAGALGVFSVRDVKNRGQFFVSAGLVFLGYLSVLGAGWIIESASTHTMFGDLLLIAINSFLLIMAYPLLWVFERTFDVTTDLTLLELSDTNRPLLKELSLRAPGTFNHSLQVANLAEASANAVGANALLTRVGALYHDIGKMLKPEYFVENQRPGDNPHDNLKPRMSALIIASHVKEGLEMGRQYNLPQRVLKFIPMHHGTTRIEYFYRKAIDQRGPEEPPVQESEFRYPGPRPDSKETGILILADSVEAASRSLSEPTHKRLETLIDMIFKARIEDGQLDNTLLTFRDLHVIRETFLNILLGIYHVRVKYPDQKEGTSGEGDKGYTGAPREANGKAEARSVQSTVPEIGNVTPEDEPAEETASSKAGREEQKGKGKQDRASNSAKKPAGQNPNSRKDEPEQPMSDEDERNLDLDPSRRAQQPISNGNDEFDENATAPAQRKSSR